MLHGFSTIKMIEDEEREALCCCEFINHKNEKSHLLAICCDCQEFDLFFTRCVTCSKQRQDNVSKMLLSFQDRLRIPWRGGAKQVSIGAIAPALAIPIAIAFAAINPIVTIIIFLSNFVILTYTFYYVRNRKLRTNFFPLWLIWSVVYMVLLFQFTVPLLEILPEENFVLVLLTGGAVYCLYRTFKRAALNQVVHENTERFAEESDCATTLLIEPDVNNIKKESNSCRRCSKEALSISSSHCDVCSLCVLNFRHHSIWLNCCIGHANYRHYFIGLILAELALLLGSNLTLTAICHPVLLQRIGSISIMIPDDCDEVFYEYRFSVAFVIAVYALIMAFFVLLECVRQVFEMFSTKIWHKNERNILRQRKSLWTDGRSFSSYVK